MKNYEQFNESLKNYSSEELKAELMRRDQESKDSLNLHPLASEFLEALKGALNQFGEYSFYDKGVDEVMNTYILTNKLTNLSIQSVAKIFTQILDYTDKELDDEKTFHFVSALIGNLDHRDDFDGLFQYDSRFEY